jgi:RHS repeat-associated protein
MRFFCLAPKLCAMNQDWLGAAVTTTRTMYNDLAYTPFGELYAQSGSTGVTNISFAGNNEDTVTNLYDAQFREYGIQGRWPSPDPAGLAAVDPANPQSWNRYAYVMNNPLNLTDPSGKRAAPEYYDINEDEAFFAGDIFDIGGAGGGDVLFGCDEFDFIAPNSFCNQIILPILTGTFTVQNWNNYYTTNGYSADPCVFANKDGSYTVNRTMSQQACGKADGQWVPPGVPFTVNSTGEVIQEQPETGWCTAMEGGGSIVVVGSGALFLYGFVAEGTVVGAPVGLASQASATVGGVLGGMTVAAGWIGIQLGVCH